MTVDTLMSRFKKMKLSHPSDFVPSPVNIEEAVLNTLNFIKHKDNIPRQQLIIKKTDLFFDNQRRINILTSFTKNIIFSQNQINIEYMNNFIDLVKLIIKSTKRMDRTFFIKYYLAEIISWAFQIDASIFAYSIFESNLDFTKDEYTLLLDVLETHQCYKIPEFFHSCKQYIDIDKIDQDGLTYLNKAVLDGDTELIKTLIELGASRSIEKSRYNNGYMMIEKYKTFGKKFLTQIDEYFCSKEDFNLEKLRHSLYEHVQWDNYNEVKKILVQTNLNMNFLSLGNYPIIMYATSNEMIDLLLSYGAQVKDEKNGMLLYCEDKVVKKFIQCGCDPQDALDMIKEDLILNSKLTEERKIRRNEMFVKRKKLIEDSQVEIKKELCNTIEQDRDVKFYKDIFDIVLDYM